MAFAEKE
jgi:DNA repair protein RadC